MLWRTSQVLDHYDDATKRLILLSVQPHADRISLCALTVEKCGCDNAEPVPLLKCAVFARCIGLVTIYSKRRLTDLQLSQRPCYDSMRGKRHITQTY